jgi:hypothetical protein
VGFSISHIAFADETIPAQPLNSSITSGRDFNILDPLFGGGILLELLDVLVILFPDLSVLDQAEEQCAGQQNDTQDFPEA